MKFINQSHKIEKAGRTCYKSEDRISPGSAAKFRKMILGRRHESVIEHFSLTVRFITNRGVSHELVRHRLASFSQESTRYVNYGGGPMIFIAPCWLPELAGKEFTSGSGTPLESDYYFVQSCCEAEEYYNLLLQSGWTPQQAHEVLPNALKTELVVSANLPEWRHILRECTSTAAHPQMRALMLPLLTELQTLIPVIFDDIAK